ncbi:hypothetical protein Lal_00024425, partial [Lupinus albus]
MDRSIIDAASGGALGDMTPFEARSLIEKMASNSQQFNARSGDAIIVRGVHDVGTNAARQDKLETKIDSLTTLITQLAINQQKSSMARVCGICTLSDHYNDMCPFLLEPRTGDHPEVFCIDEFLNIDIDVPCTSLYTCHACTDSELCDSCIDEFLNIVVDSPVTHSHCTNTIHAGIRQQSDLFVQVQAATKPSFATFFPSVFQAPDYLDINDSKQLWKIAVRITNRWYVSMPPRSGHLDMILMDSKFHGNTTVGRIEYPAIPPTQYDFKKFAEILSGNFQTPLLI